MMNYRELSISTGGRSELIEITGLINTVIREEGVSEGLCTVFIPHTTAGVTINENADPDVIRDMAEFLNKKIPAATPYFRHSEGNSDAHIKASVFGVSESIIIKGGQLLLGTWQGVYFAEFDGPRRRKIQIQLRAD